MYPRGFKNKIKKQRSENVLERWRKKKKKDVYYNFKDKCLIHC